MNWLYYLGEANLYLGVFYLCYCLFLNKETHYTLNRIYLLFSCIISFVLPLLQIGILKPVEHALTLNPVAVIPYNRFDAATAIQAPVYVAPAAEAAHFTLQDYILFAYLLGAAILLVLMAVKLYKLFQLSRAKHTVTADGYKLIYLNGSNTAFSFFNYLFIGTKAPGAATIIRHELVHIHQKHSVDIILLELFKIVNWFNPLIYLLQNSLKTVHEYIADEQTTAKDGDPLTYSSFLVDNAYGISGSSITHSFFNYNLLKKRIIMLNQQRSGSLARLKYLLAIPLCVALLCVSTLGFSKTYGWVDLVPRDATIIKKPTTHFRQALSNAVKQTPPTPKVDMVKLPERSEHKKDYKQFFINFYDKVHYPANHLKSKEAATVTVKFTITADHKLTNPAIAKSGSADFDRAALSGFLYNGTLSDKPGEHNFIIRFYYDAKSLNSNTTAYEMPGLEGIISVPALSEGKFMPPIVMPAPPTPKVTPIKFPPPVVKPDNNPAPPKVSQVRFPPPVVKLYDTSAIFDKFSMYLTKSIHYPATDRENNITGRVFASFTVDANNKVEDVKVLNGPSGTMNDEVARAIKSCNLVQGTKPGVVYTIPVRFMLSGYNGADTPPMQAITSNFKVGNPHVELNEVVVVAYGTQKD
jgi:TonB family protein